MREKLKCYLNSLLNMSWMAIKAFILKSSLLKEQKKARKNFLHHTQDHQIDLQVSNSG